MTYQVIILLVQSIHLILGFHAQNYNNQVHIISLTFVKSTGYLYSLPHTACQEPQALITGEMYRVEDEQFTASSSFSENYLPHEARLEGNSWCAQAGLGSGAWIQVDFKTYVIIQELQIGGDRGGFYINQFTIEHGPNSDQLNSILQANSNQPMVFTRLNSPSVSTTVLPTPLTTRVLRIVSVVHSGSDPCLYLEAIGCVQSPGKPFSIIIAIIIAIIIYPLSLYTQRAARL